MQLARKYTGKVGTSENVNQKDGQVCIRPNLPPECGGDPKKSPDHLHFAPMLSNLGVGTVATPQMCNVFGMCPAVHLYFFNCNQIIDPDVEVLFYTN
jgi:hypothetical protein